MKKNMMKKPRKLLCYIDFSDHSYYLVEYAFELSQLIDAELFVLHSVTDIKKAAGFYVPHVNTELLEDQVVKAARDKMYAICNQTVGDRIDADHRLVTQGSPVEDINRVIEEKQIELVVMSHEVAKGSLYGFKSDYVERFMKNATIPFLVLPVK
jgi:nucleotide-binding universal stress UspA family protein